MTTIIRILAIVAAIFTALFFASLYIPFGIIGLALGVVVFLKLKKLTSAEVEKVLFLNAIEKL